MTGVQTCALPIFQIKGKVFAAALGDPWIDVNEIVVIKKAKEPETKEAAKK